MSAHAPRQLFQLQHPGPDIKGVDWTAYLIQHMQSCWIKQLHSAWTIIATGQKHLHSI